MQSIKSKNLNQEIMQSPSKRKLSENNIPKAVVEKVVSNSPTKQKKAAPKNNTKANVR